MLQKNPEPFESKSNFYVLSALYSLKINNHLFLITPFGCSLKPGLGNNRLTSSQAGSHLCLRYLNLDFCQVAPP